MRVAITRPRERSESTVRLVEERGWEAVIIPGVEIVPRKEEEVKAAVGGLARYDWLVLTSASGAEIMLRYFGEELKKTRIAVIGPKTKEVLEERGISVELTPKEYKGENLAEELISRGIGGSRILVARASIGREILIQELKKHAEVVEVALYDTEMPRDAVSPEVLKDVDAIIFTSSQSVKNLYAAWGENLKKSIEGVKVCAIGPITAETLRGLGIRVDIVPQKYTVEACLEALT
jgi:uroporphyrinogen III methyltransferase/synthase